MEAPLPELGSEVTRWSPNTFFTQDNHNPGMFNLCSEGAGGQVKQAAAKQDIATAAAIKVVAKSSWPSLLTPYRPVNTVLKDQAAVKAPLLELGRRSPDRSRTPPPSKTTTTSAVLTSSLEELVDRWSRTARPPPEPRTTTSSSR